MSRLRQLATTFVGIMDAAVDLILPRFCAICGPTVAAEGLPNLCSQCVAALDLFESSRQCRVCAIPLVGVRVPHERCLGCHRRRPAWSSLTVLGSYDGLLSELIRRLKFGKERHLAATLGELMAAHAQSLGWKVGRFDAIVPIPLSPSREGKRGFNQALLVARGVAATLETPIERSWMTRLGSENSQVGRSARRRRKLGKGAFCAAPQVFGRRILVIDDVVTTQGTLRAAARVLREAGALDVQILCCARTPLTIK